MLADLVKQHPGQGRMISKEMYLNNRQVKICTHLRSPQVRVLQLGLRPADPDPGVGGAPRRPLRRRRPLHGRRVHHQHRSAHRMGRPHQAHHQRAHHGMSLA